MSNYAITELEEMYKEFDEMSEETKRRDQLRFDINSGKVELPVCSENSCEVLEKVLEAPIPSTTEIRTTLFFELEAEEAILLKVINEKLTQLVKYENTINQLKASLEHDKVQLAYIQDSIGRMMKNGN